MRNETNLRITRPYAKKLHTSALHAAGLSSRAIRIGLVAILLGDVAVIAGVAVDEDASHAELLSTLDFEATEDAAVLGNGNLALEVDASIDEVLIVEIGSVVDIDILTGDVAASRVAVEGGNAILGASCGVLLENVFGQRSFKGHVPGVGVALCLLQQRKAVVYGVVDVDVVGGDARLDAPRLPLFASPIGLRECAVSIEDLNCKQLGNMMAFT